MTARARTEIDYAIREPSFAHRMFTITKHFSRIFASRIEREGITDGAWRCLRALWDQDAISQRELCDQLNMTTAAGVFWVNALEKDGLVKRRADAADARKYVLRLTPKALRMRDRLRPEIAAVHRRIFGGFSAAELATFDTMLERIDANLSAMYADEHSVP